jgi:DNA-binding response OmpR family regulator
LPGGTGAPTIFSMQNVVLIGDIQALTPYSEALEREGFVATLRPAGEDGPLPAEAALIVLDLPSLGEDPVGAEALARAGGEDSAAVIGIASPEQIAAFEPVRDLDDYLPRGAQPAELAVRVRRVLWRRHRVDARNTLRVGDLAMDLVGYTVEVGGRHVELTFKEYELLRFLATNRDRVFSREVLLNKVWGYDFYGGARTVDVHVRRLRSKIEDGRHTFIETVRNVGYRFRAA